VITPFFLIDFENVQPKALDRLKPGESRIKVFLGQHQTKLMLELVQALQPFGSDAEYIQIQGSGPDAVDFHIAFYIGRLAAAHPGATFNIISKDRGFDPLVKHLSALGIGCQRLPEIPVSSASGGTSTAAAKAAGTTKPKVAKEATTRSKAKNITASALPEASGAKKAAKPMTAKARAREVVAHLRKSTKPAKLSGLRSAIKSWFKPELLDDKAVDAVIQSLKGSKKIAIVGTKVTYASAD
jgi:PIN domain